MTSPYCTSVARIDPLGLTRCDKKAGHKGWHRWQIEWTDPSGLVQVTLRPGWPVTQRDDVPEPGTATTTEKQG